MSREQDACRSPRAAPALLDAGRGSCCSAILETGARPAPTAAEGAADIVEETAKEADDAWTTTEAAEGDADEDSDALTSRMDRTHDRRVRARACKISREEYLRRKREIDERSLIY